MANVISDLEERDQMNYKRKRSHKQVRCTSCTNWSWLGNTKERKPIQDRKQRQRKLHEDSDTKSSGMLSEG